MALVAENSSYVKCRHVKREKPEYIIDETAARELGRAYRTLPTFEKSVHDHIYRNYYSLESNEFLKCRWQLYKQHIEERVFAPFQFPDVRDLHFYNNKIQYRPALSIHKMINYRLKMNLGPGVDFYGQVPIPYESLMQRGTKPKGGLGPKKKKRETTKKLK